MHTHYIVLFSNSFPPPPPPPPPVVLPTTSSPTLVVDDNTHKPQLLVRHCTLPNDVVASDPTIVAKRMII